MSRSTIDASAKERLRALNPDIPMLASQAAIELDNLRLGRHPQLGAVARLGKLLTNSVEKDHAAGTTRALMDPATMAVIGQALGNIDGTRAVKTLDQLLEQAWDLALNLKGVGAGEKPADMSIDMLRDFCVALSDCALSYVQSIRDLQPSHPYRR